MHSKKEGCPTSAFDSCVGALCFEVDTRGGLASPTTEVAGNVEISRGKALESIRLSLASKLHLTPAAAASTIDSPWETDIVPEQRGGASTGIPTGTPTSATRSHTDMQIDELVSGRN